MPRGVSRGFCSGLKKTENASVTGYLKRKKRYGLFVLNYIVILNHIHLLVVDSEEDVIAKSLQMVAGKTA